MYKLFTTSAIVALSAMLAGCDATAFRSGTKEDTPTRPVITEVSPTEEDANPPPTPSESPQPTVEPTHFPENPTEVLCEKKDFKILILDLKSGWFAGDGGDFFKKFVAQECEDSIQIHYMHITTQFAEGNFAQFASYKNVLPCLEHAVPNSKGQLEFKSLGDPNDVCQLGPISEYNQLWLLSGAEQDPYDLRLAKPLFQSIKSRATELRKAKPNSGFFLGAGLGNSDHANSLALTVFSDVFTDTKPFSAQMSTPNTGVGVFPNPKQMLSEFGVEKLIAGDGKQPGTYLSTDSTFANPLFDFEKKAGRIMTPVDSSYTKTFKLGECFTNPIITKNVTTLATDHCGNKAIATTKIGQHTLFLEGNMGRFYGTQPGEYFHRIILQLLP